MPNQYGKFDPLGLGNVDYGLYSKRPKSGTTVVPMVAPSVTERQRLHDEGQRGAWENMRHFGPRSVGEFEDTRGGARPIDELGRFTDVDNYVSVDDYIANRQKDAILGSNTSGANTEPVESIDSYGDFRKRTRESDDKQQELLSKKPGLLGGIMDFFTSSGQKLHDLMTDDKGLFQGGEGDRIFGRIRDVFDPIQTEPMAELNTAIIPEKTHGSAGVIMPGLPKKIVKTPNPDNPNYAKYEIVDQTVQPGQNVVYGGIATGYKPIKVVNRELTIEELERAKIAKYIQDNPNATRADIRMLEKESNLFVRKYYREMYKKQREEAQKKARSGNLYRKKEEDIDEDIMGPDETFQDNYA
tara:strand:- start:662 stop:1729 length:1068 start_codon:yes stop_codon:yes gene_type:complete